jgi:hypothetical protein
MHARPQKRRRKGSLAALQTGLYTMFQRHLEFVEDSDDLETITKSSTVAVQIALAYMRVCELTEIEQDMKRYEHLAEGNGHQP